MSVVTGIFLLTCVCEEGETALDEVQGYLSDEGLAPLADVSDVTGGMKHPQYLALGAGYNYFGSDDLAAFVTFVLTRDWHVPECVVLTVKPESGRTAVYRPAREHYLDEPPGG